MPPDDINLGVAAQSDFNKLKKDLAQSADSAKKLNKQFENINKTFERTAAALIKQVSAVNAQTQALSKNNKVRERQTVTNNQLIKQEMVIHSLFTRNSNVARQKYLTSINGLTQGLRQFNQESKTTLVRQRGHISLLSDNENAYTRFVMKGHMVSQTLDAMSRKFVNLGKNLQWTGRQMMVGITMPMAAAGFVVGKTYLDWNRAIARNEKLLNKQNGSIKEQSKALQEMAKATAVEFGIDPTEVANTQNVFAAIRDDVNIITKLTKLSTEFNILGDLQDMGKATELVRVVWQGLGGTEGAIAETRKELERFNKIENETNLQMADIAEGLPNVISSLKRMNMTVSEGAAFMTAITQQGVSASEAANALKFALGKLPTAGSLIEQGVTGGRLRLKATIDAINDFNRSNPTRALDFFDGDKLKSGTDILLQLGRAWGFMGDAQKQVFAQAAFGTNQIDRLDGMLSNISITLSDPSKATDFMKAMEAATDDSASATERWIEEMSVVLDQDYTKVSQFWARLKIAAIEAGKVVVDIFLPALEDLVGIVEKATKWFTTLEDGTKKFIGQLALLVGLVGPITYGFGQFVLLFGQLSRFSFTTPLKALFGMERHTKNMSNNKDFLNAFEEINERFRETGDARLMQRELDGLIAKQKGLATATDQATNAMGRQNRTLKGRLTRPLAAIRPASSSSTAGAEAAAQTATADLRNRLGMTPVVISKSKAQVEKELIAKGVPAGTAKGAANASILAHRRREQEELARVKKINDLAIINLREKENIAKQRLAKEQASATRVESIVNQQVKAKGKLNRRLAFISGGMFGNFHGDVSSDEVAARTQLAEFGIDAPSRKQLKQQKQGGLIYGPAAPRGTSLKRRTGRVNPLAAAGKAGKAAGRTGLNVMAAAAPGTMFKNAASGASKLGQALASNTGKMGAFKGALTSMLTPIDMFTGGMGSAAVSVAPMVTSLGFLGPLIPVILLVAGAVLLIWKNWDKVKKGIGGGLESLKKAFNAVKEAIIGPFRDIFDRLAGDGEGMSAMWENVGKILNVVFHTVGEVMKSVAVFIRPIMNILSELFYILIQIAKFVVSVFTMQWSDAFDAIKGITASAMEIVTEIMLFPLNMFLKGLTRITGIVGGNRIGKALGLDSLDNKVEGFSDWIEDAPEGIANAIDGRKSREKIGRAARDAGKGAGDKFTGGAEDQINNNPLDIDETQYEEAGNDAANAFVSALQNRLRQAVDAWKQAAIEAFDKWSKVQIEGIDNQIKAIDDLRKAEQQALADKEYIARREEMLQKRRYAQNRYHIEREKAIYEGRYDDALQLDFDHNIEMEEADKEIKELDEDRSRELVERERDLQVERLNIQKDAKEKELDIQKSALEAQLDMITEYIPRSAAAATQMQQAILGALGAYTGQYGVIAAQQAEGWKHSWKTSMDAARKDMAEEAFWAGAAALDGFAYGIGIPATDIRDNVSKIDPLSFLHDTETAGGVGGNESPAGRILNDAPYIPRLRTNMGGGISFYHSGGKVGSLNSAPQDVPATLQTGEYVIKRSSVAKYGKDTLDALNAGTYHEGGLVVLKGLLGKALSSFGSGEGTIGGANKHQIGALLMAAANAAKGRMVPLSGEMGPAGEHPISALAHYLVKKFPGSRISSMFRPGAVTAHTKNRSLHGFGRAVDIGGSREAMGGVFDYLLANANKYQLAELIYEHKIWSPSKGLYRWPHKDHFDHVHAGIKAGINTGNLPQLAKGAHTLSDGVAYLHKRETVLTEDLSDKLIAGIEALNSGNVGGNTLVVGTLIADERGLEMLAKRLDAVNVKIGRAQGNQNRSFRSK